MRRGRKRDGERGKSIAGMRAGVSKGDRNLWGKGAGRKKGPVKSQGVRRKWNGKREKLIWEWGGGMKGVVRRTGERLRIS